MSSCVFNQCCGFINLKTGCFIIGYLSMITNTYETIVYALALAADNNFNVEHNKEAYAISILVIVISVIFIIASLLDLIFDIVLVVGLHKNKPGHLKAYLVATVISVTLTLVNSIRRFLLVDRDVKYEFLTAFIINIFNIYFLLVIRSMYLRMTNEHSGIIYSTGQSGYTTVPLVHNTGILVPNGAHGYHQAPSNQVVYNNAGILVPNGAHGYHQAPSNQVAHNNTGILVSNGAHGYHQAPSNQVVHNNTGVAAPNDPYGYSHEAPPSYDMCKKM